MYFFCFSHGTPGGEAPTRYPSLFVIRAPAFAPPLISTAFHCLLKHASLFVFTGRVDSVSGTTVIELEQADILPD